MAKLLKDNRLVVYMGAERGPFRCERCEYFERPNNCHKVAGYIEPRACCNLFEPVSGTKALSSR